VINTLAWLIPLLPLVACLVTLVLGAKVLKQHAHWPAILGCAGACLCSWLLASQVGKIEGPEPKSVTVTLYQWMYLQPEEALPGTPPAIRSTQAATQPLLDVKIALRVDSLSALMLSMLTCVATLVAIYASGYMHGDRGYWRFFCIVSLFVFSMIMLVLSANFLQLFMFWEAVGLCSYLLIGFWYEKPAAAAAGKKAFLVNRIGDFGFAIGVFLLWTTFGSVDYATVLNPAVIRHIAPSMLTVICLCLFMGAVGKSAQFPLHVWLPDAMEGPTPVSALIHAATMVTAGVYLVARATPLFMAAPEAQLVVACIGGFTALLAALIALTQTDLKRVLAYSTVSQLGYMFLGLGTGLLSGIGGAMFHLVTHAFFKALLFLGAGSVMHAMGGVIDMREFRGLRRIMPQTYLTFMIGAAALAGLPPLSGFWSKDTILSAVHTAAHPQEHAAAGHGATDAAHEGSAPAKSGAHRSAGPAGNTPELLGFSAPTIYNILFWMGTLTALLTAFYTFRAALLTFHGPEKIPHAAGHHAHESPPSMCIPLWILAAGALLIGGALGHLTGLFDNYLGLTIPGVGAHHDTDWFVLGMSTVVATLGVVVAWMMYAAPSELPEKVARMFGPLTRLSWNKFYIDEIYFVLFVLPLRAAALLSRFIDWLFIDRVLVDGTSRLPVYLVARKIIQPLQNGLVQFYALSMILALAVLLAALLLNPVG
jgi:NADH-quinone oxidoreductase subunit L